MKNLIRYSALCLALLPSVGAAQDFEKGLAASEAGDYITALQEWRLLAAQGDAKAQLNLGAMNYNGQGVPQDYVSAHMWFNLAAANGNGDAIKSRDLVASKMTLADVSEAQRRAMVCRSSAYQGCDLPFNLIAEIDGVPKVETAIRIEPDELPSLINKCWNVGQLSSDAMRTVVTLRVVMSKAGKPTSVEMTSSEGGTEASAQQAFEAARRAVMRCAGATGYNLRPEEHEQWKVLNLVFDTKGLQIR